MTVVRGQLCLKEFRDDAGIARLPGDLDVSSFDKLSEGIAINSTAFESVGADGKTAFLGSKTETALLGFLAKLGPSYKEIRAERPAARVYPFSSERKRMSAIVKTASGYRIHVKGAAEIILNGCVSVLHSDGSVRPLDSGVRSSMDSLIVAYAREALRNICLAYRDMTVEEFEALTDDDPAPDTDLVLIGIVGIEDPLRPEVRALSIVLFLSSL
jgi:Ca2+-transporting ATPase